VDARFGLRWQKTRWCVVRLTGKETDLTFSVAGRTWRAADGRINMPDGEFLLE
jgi:leucyl aminopeptidase (aminopeptidase T)